ncbi:MAG TPA: ABC transporter substrate-binding protein [Chloroflexota bacterium]|nr:ABC transporter substrate-binding protein [Chloroflexota bacterium]
MKRGQVFLAITMLAVLLVACAGSGGGVSSAARSASAPPPTSEGAPSSGQMGAGASATGAAAPTGAPAAPAALVPLKAAYTAIATAQAAFWLGVEGGYFHQQGLDVELIRLDGSSRAMPALLSGDVPISMLTGAAVAGAAAQGADVVFVASGAPNLVFQVVAAPQITSFEELRGQPVGSTGIGSSSDFALRYALRRNGLDPERGVISRNIAGGDAQILAALQSGAILATAFAPPTDYFAVQQGFRSLARLADWDVAYQGAGVVTTKSFIASQRDTMLRFMRAYVAAVHRAKTDPAFALGVMRQYTGIEDQGSLEWGYHQYVDAWPPAPYASPAGLQGVIDSLVPSNPDVAKVDPTTLVDSSLLEELEASGYVAGLYGR